MQHLRIKKLRLPTKNDYTTKITLAIHRHNMSDYIKKFIMRSANLIAYREYIPTEHFIYDNRKLIYISIPKVACTSIKIGLMANELDTSVSSDEYMNVHADTSNYVRYSIKKSQDNYYKFVFVRNPFDRLVSCYKDKIKKIQHSGKYHFDTSYNKVLIKNMYGDMFSTNMDFDDFVRLVSKIPDWLSDGHFKSQYSMIYKNRCREPDYIGKFETLAYDWNVIATKYGLEKLGDKNKTANDNWKDYYTNKDTVELVYKRYYNDITAFEYENDYTDLITKL